MGGKSSSKSSNATTYSNTDKRVVADGFGAGVSGDGNAVNYSVRMTTTDAGAIKGGVDVARKALEVVQASDATAGEGFSKLLDLAGALFEGGATALERSQEMTAQAYRESVETRQATIDNKTITAIAVAGAVAIIGYGAIKK